MNTTPGAYGYTVDPTQQAAQTFGVSAGNRTVLDQAAGGLEALMSAGQPVTVVTALTGTDFTREMPAAVGADQHGANAGVNVEASATVGAKQETMQDRKAAFKTAVEDMQKPIQEALQQGVETLSLSEVAADNSFQPIHTTETFDVLLEGGAAKAGLSAFTAISSGIDDVRSIAGGKLSPEQEAKLADQMRVLLTPTRDPLTGEVTAPPAIANNFDENMLNSMKERPAELIQFFKQALLPAEDQPEWDQFMAHEEHLKNAAGHHGRERNVDEAVLALAEAAGTEASLDVIEQEADTRLSLVSDGLAAGSGGMRADETALMRINVAVLPDPAERYALIVGGADVRDTPEGGFSNEPDERLLAMNVGAGLMG